ncbi:MAG: hypothetical protein HC918_13725, partial [Oscillatoriales cyanobacterium SM2_1_8]|nr:hypothetical protein [Oscillatoriales cyanobacterium SM2_1_8]
MNTKPLAAFGSVAVSRAGSSRAVAARAANRAWRSPSLPNQAGALPAGFSVLFSGGFSVVLGGAVSAVGGGGKVGGRGEQRNPA